MSEVSHHIFEIEGCKVEYWVNSFGILDRIDGPSVCRYYSDGNLEYEVWYKGGEVFRSDGPSMIWYYSGGQKSAEQWYCGKVLDRRDGPAYIRYWSNGNLMSEDFYIGGKRCGINGGPSSILYYSNGSIRRKFGEEKEKGGIKFWGRKLL